MYTSRQYQEAFFFPGTSTLKGYLRGSISISSLVIVDVINRADMIYDPSIPNVQGQTIVNMPPIHKIIVKVHICPIV